LIPDSESNETRILRPHGISNENFEIDEDYETDDNSERLDMYSQKKNAQTLLGAPLELIEISSGYCYNWQRVDGPFDMPDQIYEWLHPEQPKKTEKYIFYNVMWIGWKDGIAHRRGLGRVEKSVWERQELDTIDVTLG